MSRFSWRLALFLGSLVLIVAVAVWASVVDPSPDLFRVRLYSAIAWAFAVSIALHKERPASNYWRDYPVEGLQLLGLVALGHLIFQGAYLVSSSIA